MIYDEDEGASEASLRRQNRVNTFVGDVPIYIPDSDESSFMNNSGIMSQRITVVMSLLKSFIVIEVMMVHKSSVTWGRRCSFR